MNEREVPLTANPGDILSIVKKFLFSEREVFLRELVSNALDALEKLEKVIRYEPGFNGEVADLRVTLVIDPARSTITITDNGIGMSEEEVIRYINQIAVSGAREFLEQHKDGAQHLNGKFGLGFYSSFMVSKEVEIDTWSWKPGAGGCHWSCSGGTTTRIGATSRRDRGTSVICHLNSDAIEFIDPQRLDAVVKRFLDFSAFPIFHAGRQLNLVTAPWHLNRTEREQMGREKYCQLYERLNPGENQPVAWFHADADYPVEARALLFLPDREIEARGKLRVLANRTFLSDDCPALLPQWLSFVDGVLDAPSLPINLARDRLQENPQIISLRNFLIKKTLDFLIDLLEKRRADYASFWERYGAFLKRGYFETWTGADRASNGRIEKLLLFGSSRKPLTTLREYFERTSDSEEHKLLYLTDERAQASHLQLLRNQNREVLCFTDPRDAFLPEVLKRVHSDWMLQRIDEQHVAEAEGVMQPPSEIPNAPGDWDALRELFRDVAGPSIAKFSFERMPSKDIPAVLRVTRDGVIQDVLRRFADKESGTDSKRVLVLNTNCPLVQSLGQLGSRLRQTELSAALVAQVWDNVRLGAGLLKDDEASEVSRRHTDFLTLIAAQIATSESLCRPM